MAKKYPGRIEELPVIERMLYNALNRDQPTIVLKLPKYTPAFLASFDLKIKEIEALIFPEQITAELKKVTANIYTNLTLIRPMLNDFESDALTAEPNLTMAAKDMGYMEVRVELGRKNVEGIVSKMSSLIQNIEKPQNLTALQSPTVGFTVAMLNAMKSLRDSLKNDNLTQQTKLEEREALVADNESVFNDSWTKFGKLVNGDGRRWAKANAAAKVPDYTVAALQRNIRQEQLKNEIAGKTFAADGSGNLVVSIQLIPILGGKKRTTKSKNGVYSLKSLTYSDFQIVGTCVGFKDFTKPVTVVSGKTVVDMAMVRL